MPFFEPFQTQYQDGDLFYGLRNPRQKLMTQLCFGPAYLKLFKNQGWIDTFKIQSKPGNTLRN